MTLIIDYPVIIGVVGATLIGITSGIVSCYCVLKEQSLLGDAIAHAALPGICIAFLLSFNKNPLLLFLGAFVAGIIGTVLINAIIQKSLIKQDTALGVILSVFFGFGTLLLTMIQKIPTARQTGLDTYLFGSAASMLTSDLMLMGVLSLGIVAVTLLLWKEIKGYIFDCNFLKTQGFSKKNIELTLIFLTVLTIIIGLQTVGVILMSALIIAPATGAKLWQKKLGPMMILSIIFSTSSGILGVFVSSSVDRLPTGPVIVTIISAIVFISLFFSPHGLVIQWVQSQYNKRSIRLETILTHLYTLAKTHDDLSHPHDIQTLTALGGAPALSLLQKLEKEGLIYCHKNNSWGLTDAGVSKATQLLHRES
jgi:manganese/zinc/iron transport system permease protein